MSLIKNNMIDKMNDDLEADHIKMILDLVVSCELMVTCQYNMLTWDFGLASGKAFLEAKGIDWAVEVRKVFP